MREWRWSWAGWAVWLFWRFVHLVVMPLVGRPYVHDQWPVRCKACGWVGPAARVRWTHTTLNGLRQWRMRCPHCEEFTDI